MSWAAWWNCDIDSLIAVVAVTVVVIGPTVQTTKKCSTKGKLLDKLPLIEAPKTHKMYSNKQVSEITNIWCSVLFLTLLIGHVIWHVCVGRNWCNSRTDNYRTSKMGGNVPYESDTWQYLKVKGHMSKIKVTRSSNSLAAKASEVNYSIDDIFLL